MTEEEALGILQKFGTVQHFLYPTVQAALYSRFPDGCRNLVVFSPNESFVELLRVLEENLRAAVEIVEGQNEV